MPLALVVLLSLLLLAPAAHACHPVMAGEPDHGCGDVIKAATHTVTVGDDFFSPDVVRIAPGDTVNWQWQNAGAHTVTTFPNQTERFDSGTRSGNASFSHVFNRRGRFMYFCELHPSTMRAAVEVGEPPFPDTTLPRIRGPKARPATAAVTLTFTLSETAAVRVVLAGPTRKRFTRRLRRGRRSVRVLRLRGGRYRAALIPRDAAGNRGRTARVRFRVR